MGRKTVVTEWDGAPWRFAVRITMCQAAIARRSPFLGRGLRVAALLLVGCGTIPPTTRDTADDDRTELHVALHRFTLDCAQHGPAVPGDAVFEAPRVLVELWLVALPEGPTPLGKDASPGAVANATGARLLGTPHADANVEQPTRVELSHLVIPTEPQRLRFVDATVTPRLRSPVDLVIDVDVTLEQLDVETAQRHPRVLHNTFVLMDGKASHVLLPIEGTEEVLFLGVRSYIARSATDLRDHFLCNLERGRAAQSITR
jgi:hypothetical protein